MQQISQDSNLRPTRHIRQITQSSPQAQYHAISQVVPSTVPSAPQIYVHGQRNKKIKKSVRHLEIHHSICPAHSSGKKSCSLAETILIHHPKQKHILHKIQYNTLSIAPQTTIPPSPSPPALTSSHPTVYTHTLHIPSSQQKNQSILTDTHKT